MPALSRHNEEEWRRLRRQLQLSDGFWLGFLFTSAPAVASEFRSRVQGFLKHRAKRFRVLRPETPDGLVELLSDLLAPEVEHEGCIWVEALRVDPLGTENGPWITAWDSFLLRLNERRERLRRRLPGGLLLVAPRTVKPRVREAAPDLWSIRGPVIELRAERSVWREELRSRGMEVAEATVRPSRPERRSEPPAGSTDLPPENQEAKAAELLRGAEGLLASDRPEQAVTEAVKAVTLLRRLPEPGQLDLANAKWTLARARLAEGDMATAELDLDEALALRDDDTDRKWLERLDLRGELALRRQDLSTAEQVYRQALDLCRARLAKGSDREVALRDVSVGLNKVGDIQRKQGDESGALASYEESLRLFRRLLSEYGESALRLRDLSVSLEQVGDVQHSRGDELGALTSYEDSLSLRRRVLSEYGESAKRLRDVSLILVRVGDIQMTQGDESLALSSYEESLRLSRRLLSEYGESADRLRDISVSLNKVGDLQCSQGDESGALSSYEESLQLRRRLALDYGESAERLRDVLVSLERVGNVQLSQAAESAALSSYEESLSLRRRLVSEYGESAERLRDFSVGLIKVGDVQASQVDKTGALASYEEALRYFLRLVSEYGESAERLRDVAVCLVRLATVQHQQGNTGEAVELLREAVELSERIIAEYGETPARRADVKHDRQKLAELEEALTARVPES